MSLRRIAPIVALLAACSTADEKAAPSTPPRGVLEVVIEDSPAIGNAAEGAILAGMCLRGDPMRGDPWLIDGIADSITALPLDPLHDLAPRDSARTAARLARTADALPSDTSVADFRGLPVVIRDAWLLVPSVGDTTYIAIAARRMPMESNPLEEELTFLASPSPTGSRGGLESVWNMRSAGTEDSLEVRHPVLAFIAPDGAPRLLMLRESAEGPRAELLVRTDGRWRSLWIGVMDNCR